MVLRVNTRKILQRRSYDLLSHKYSFLFILIALIILVILSVQFGEVWMIWSQEKYESFFFSFSDNIKGVSLQDKLCQNLPIDAVYTWVNGSDPLLMQDLLKYQAEMQDEVSRLCPYQNCVPSHIAVLRQIGTLPVSEIYIPETGKWINFEIKSDLVTDNRTLLYLSTTDEAAITVKFIKSLQNENLSVSHAHWTSDKSAPNAYTIYNSLILSGIPMLSLHETRETLEAFLKQISGGKVMNMWVHIAKKVIVVEFMSNEVASTILKHFAGNLTFRGHTISITNAFIAFDLPPIGDPRDFSPSRFEDKEELRYSLRSLEKFAPWIRHVYLVTNGQIPYWLNLDNPRLTIITHYELFPNTSHLPTFSSPAIEAHLHRIPGLSSKFLYFNDDLILGKEVWPEDFITYANGQKVYFSWAVPDCSESCPWSWVNDGSCDLSCNISECFFDGGDCNPANMYIMDEGALYEDSQHVFENTNDNFDNTLNNDDNSDWLNHFINDKNIETEAGDKTELEVPFNDIMYGNYSERQSFLMRSEGNNSSHNIPYSKIHQQENLTVEERLSKSNKLNFSVLNMLKTQANMEHPKIINNNRNSDLKTTNQLEMRPHQNYTKQSYMPINPTLRFHNVSKPQTATPAEYLTMNNHVLSNLSVAPDTILGRKTRKLFYFNMLKNIHDDGDFRVDKTRENQERISHKILLKTRKQQRLSSKMNYKRKSNDRTRDANSYSFDRWRNKKIMNDTENFQNNKSKYSHNSHYSSASLKSYRDTFAESLLYVNGIYNKEFGFEARKVPAHMPHLIDQEIIHALQLRFKDEWELTSSHKIRSQNDMQYAFSYFYFLMSENKSVPVSDIFDAFDTDHSGTWSDREIRTLLTRLYDLPLVYNKIVYFEEKIINCSKVFPKEMSVIDIPTPMYERYQDSKLPIVSKQLISNCKPVASLLKEKFGTIKKYKYEIVKDKYQDVSFKMLNSNLSQLISYLDDVRKQPKKFICLNDNFDPTREKDNVIARAILQDFYESLFPIPSSFELPAEFRNRFLHTSDLKEWRMKRNFVKVFIFLCLTCLILFTLINFFQQECQSLHRKVFHIDSSARRRIRLDV